MACILCETDPLPTPAAFYYNYPLAASWIGPEQVPVDCGFWALRRQVTLAEAQKVRIHVSADQRYILYVNGKRVGRGSERGDLRHWMFETYDLDLPAGPSTIVAVVWWLSLTGATPPPWAQVTQRPGFWLLGEGPAAAWNTGQDGWSIKPIEGVSIEGDQDVHFHPSAVGPRVAIDGTRYPWNIEHGQGDGWQPATTIQPAAAAAHFGDSLSYWLLRPAMLPAMREAAVGGWKVRHVDVPPSLNTINYRVQSANHLQSDSLAGLSSGTAATIAPNTRRRVIIDLETYACAFYRLAVSGGRGAKIRLRWAESLYESAGKPVSGAGDVSDKGDRSKIEGRHFLGTGDVFIADGTPGRAFEPLWWNSGRYIELVIETGNEPLTIDGLEIIETGYPYEFQSAFAADDQRLAEVRELSLHTLRMCSHETSMDCPYYEQLNYTGDTRLQSLIAMTHSRDDRLVRKSLQLFDWSRTGDNWSHSRYPTSNTQTIPTFAMWWVCMARDFALWRGDLDFVKTLMPGVRSILERWREQIGSDGLLRQPAGWNFVDWVNGPHWAYGMINPALGTPCGVIQWQLVYTLMQAAELEDWLGEPLLAQRNRQTAATLAATAERAYYDPQRKLLAADLEHTKFCEHPALLALLSGQLSENLRGPIVESVLGNAPIDRATIYFQHYVFETLALLGRGDVILDRLGLWYEHSALGMSTLRESPEPTRSDCHAWAGHPAYHFYASILGIRPTEPGFRRVRITPKLGRLKWAKGEMVHPLGTIRFDLQNGPKLTGRIELPPGLEGELVVGAQVIPASNRLMQL